MEGSLEKSAASNIALTGVSRANYGELLEDYHDFLRQHHLPIWRKDDPRSLKIRSFRESPDRETNLSNLSHWTNLDFSSAENFANLIICLLYKETYLLDQLLRAQEAKFVREGGFCENLLKKRLAFKKSKLG